jgi:lipoyl(octanoyl) transferase
VAIYLIVPLRWHGMLVGEYLDRLQWGILGTLEELGVAARTQPGQHGIWGRTGQLAAFGAAVRHEVAFHGAFVNVCPPMGLFRLVQSDPIEQISMSCLVAELGKPTKMTTVRAELVCRLADAFGCDRYHLHTGHPLLGRSCVKQR